MVIVEGLARFHSDLIGAWLIRSWTSLTADRLRRGVRILSLGESADDRA
jgi:hypothetical protein